MPPKEKPQSRPVPDILPDSLPDKEILPDDLRRRDQPRMPPDSLPPREDDLPLTGHGAAPDGGAEDHPIHDEPMEDLKPEDFEAQVDEAARGQLERRTEDELIDPRATHEFAPGSSEPLDSRNRGPLPTR